MRRALLLSALLIMLAFLAHAQPVTITPPSANIQPGESVTLTASGALYYQWSPATGLSTTDGPVTVASPTVTTTYTCSGFALGDESVVNSNFDQGNVGFTSAYQYNTNLWGEGTYYVDYDASLHHESFHGLGHGGTGNFMMVNGATSPGTNVWTEQITVHPNTYYAFSTWVCTLAGQANEVAQLQFSINNVQIGEIFTAPPTINDWRQFYVLWHSGTATTATITILNQNTVGSGNDFGLDDISFCELVVVGEPQCTVYVGSMSATATADDTELCQGESTTLHAMPTGGSGHYSYSWTPANTLDDPTTQHPMATPGVGTTTYTCHIVDVDWSNTQDVSIAVTVHPTYDETIINEAICPGETYTFYGTTYDHSVQTSYTDHTAYECDSIVYLNLTVYPPNDTTVVDAGICVGESYNFHGTLYNQDGQIAYFDTVDYHGCLKVEKLVLSVGEYQTQPTEYVYRCYGQDETPYYKWDKNNEEYHSDTDAEAIVPDPAGGCDFKYRLHLEFHQEFYSEEEPVVTCDRYEWPLTGEVFTETNHHVVRNFHGGGGPHFDCDSIYVLDITINEQAILPDKYLPDSCDFAHVTWFCGIDTTFTENTVYTFTGHTEDSCYMEQTFYIENMRYSPNPAKIHCTDPNAVVYGIPGAEADTIAVVTNTEFFSFQYTFKIMETNGECVWDDSCKWTISKPTWAIEYDPMPKVSGGKYYSECKVYVAEHDDNLVELTATPKNGCGSKERKFYLKSSFLGMDEDNCETMDVDIVPNPNNGQMKLVFNHFEGKAIVKVYDVSGSLVDSFETYNNGESKALEYALNVRKGLYFFVVNGGEGTLVKKVVIE